MIYRLEKVSKMGTTAVQSLGYFASYGYFVISLHDLTLFLLLKDL